MKCARGRRLSETIGVRQQLRRNQPERASVRFFPVVMMIENKTVG